MLVNGGEQPIVEVGVQAGAVLEVFEDGLIVDDFNLVQLVLQPTQKDPRLQDAWGFGQLRDAGAPSSEGLGGLR